MSLNKDKDTTTWEQEVSGALQTKLHIKQLLLGHDAKPDEYNVIELELDNKKKQVVAVLKLGETQSSLADIEISRGVAKFKLVSGSGPVHIMGLQFPEITEIAPYDHESYDEEDEFEVSIAELFQWTSPEY